jgi:hypothetical protein
MSAIEFHDTALSFDIFEAFQNTMEHLTGLFIDCALFYVHGDEIVLSVPTTALTNARRCAADMVHLCACTSASVAISPAIHYQLLTLMTCQTSTAFVRQDIQ